MLSRMSSVARAGRSHIPAISAGRLQHSSTKGQQHVATSATDTSRSVFLGGAAAAMTAAAWYARSEVCGDRGVLRAEDATSEFSGKVVVIAGAAGDFGRAGIETFRREGANVILLDAAPQTLETSESTLQKAAGSDIFAVRCDVTNTADVEAAVLSIEKKFGRITHLWNNAGYQGNAKMAMGHSAEDFEKVQENVVGTFRVLEGVANSMKKTGGGVIVNTASVAGLHGTPAMPAYVASKSAVLGLTKSAAKDLAPFNIRVNAVSPGSPYFSCSVPSAPATDVAAKPESTNEEVLKAVVFLMSEESGPRRGTNLAVEKGLFAH